MPQTGGKKFTETLATQATTYKLNLVLKRIVCGLIIMFKNV